MALPEPSKGLYPREMKGPNFETGSIRSASGSIHDFRAKSTSPVPPQGNSPGSGPRTCILSVHDEVFSREDVLFNRQAVGDLDVKIGALLELSPVCSDFSDSAQDADTRSQGGGNFSPSSSRPGGGDAGGTGYSRYNDQGNFLFIAKQMSQELINRHPNLQVSVSNHIANTFGLKKRSPVTLAIKQRKNCSATYVELVFRDQFLLRSDMWRLCMSELVDRPLYKGQKIVFMNSIKATIKSIHIENRKVMAGYFTADTIPVFRSESARYVLFIQMSKEMWDFDTEGTGDILFSRVINSLLPELFKRWASIDARHLVTIVLFTRVQFDHHLPEDFKPMIINKSSLKQPSDQPRSNVQDFYRVVVNDMPSGQWTAILDELKKEFGTFLRDILIPPPHFPENPMAAEDVPKYSPEDAPLTIAGHTTSAIQGNILEAIHIASSYLAFEYVGRDLVRTGTSIVVITPGTGVFEVGFDILALTSDALTSRAIGIDLICLSPMPLHAVPLFKYKLPKHRPSDQHATTSKDTPVDTCAPSSPCESASPTSFSSVWDKKTIPLSRANSSAPQPSRTVDGNTASEEWGYGIPYWVDVSFWDPQQYRDKKSAKKHVMAPALGTVTRGLSIFQPKVRMYEIQMMGVMESEQSNISIPNLRIGDSITGSLNTQTPNAGNMSSSTSYLASHSSSHKPQGKDRDKDRPASFMYSLKDSKKYMMSSQARQRSKLLEWMDAYDQSTFHISSQTREPRALLTSKSMPKLSSRARVVEQAAKRPTHFSRESDASSIVRKNKNTYPSPRVVETPPVMTKPPARAPAKADRKSSLKDASKPAAPRASRSISFALLGLGRAPPTAVASTQVKAEHAKGLPTAGGKTPDEAAIESPKTPDHHSRSSSQSLPEAPEESSADESHHTTEPVTSRPISIKTPIYQNSNEPNIDARPLDGSYSTAITEIRFGQGTNPDGRSAPPLKRTGWRLDMAGNSHHSDASTPSPAKALAPWIRPVKPWNPPKHSTTRGSWFGRWHHVHPRMPTMSQVNWKSLKYPATLPLTTEEFPTEEELESNYFQTPYGVYQNDDSEATESPKTREALLREMIALRLSQGFQIVVGKALEFHGASKINVFDPDSLARDDITILMTMGNIIHRLVCVGRGEIEVTRYTRKPLNGYIQNPHDFEIIYSPAVKTILSAQYCKNSIHLGFSHEDYNWNFADAFLAGHRDHLTDTPRQLKHWQTRFVLIPVQVSANMRRISDEDNEEELHLLGIYQLTQMWQRHKYVPSEEKRLQSATSKKRDQNPLNILYQTCDPSVVVAAELDRLLFEDPRLDNPPAQLLPESELLQKSSFTLSSLAQAIQGEKGVRMMDRRWHWRLHYNCFIGIELTTWLLQNFRDIDSRDEAVEFGNELMKLGLFHHVQRRHNFRDGNYFYQITDEYRISRPESKASWFQPRKPDKSVPNTPIAGDGIKDSPSSLRAKSDHNGDELLKVDTATPPRSTRNKVAIWLAKSMKYDLDPRKRSDRPEIIDLHYDRLHNPDNCFHIKLSWMNATPKLVEDAIVSWTGVAEKYGLRLVELPISEVSSIVESQVFRRPYPIKFKYDPPDPPSSMIFTSSSFASHGSSDRHYYQKALLKKFDFVLDFEASSSFPTDVEVSYSWGKPDYRFPQFVHRTGAVLAQITDEGNFLLLANRLFNMRGTSTSIKDSNKHERGEYFRPRASTVDPAVFQTCSPHLSPVVRDTVLNGSLSINTQSTPTAAIAPNLLPESINIYRLTDSLKDQIQAFCNDKEKIENFFVEVATNAKPASASTKITPTSPITADALIPALELPASIVRPLQLTSPLQPTQRPASIDNVMQGTPRYSPQ
ncbi:vacuolar membrane-associated protein iml1 [Myotisia sp. PD_48]|nr:vacuolar membrane-associated protein iml1 [Myotisia sp. PD_48]